MMRAFIDANIFVRLLAGDDEEKAARCLKLFKDCDGGDVELMTSEAIIAEIVYVLSSKTLYGQTRDQIADKLMPLLQLPGLRVTHKQTVLNAMSLYRTTNISFEDCLAIEHASREELDGIYSYDRKLGRATDILRIEP